MSVDMGEEPRVLKKEKRCYEMVITFPMPERDADGVKSTAPPHITMNYAVMVDDGEEIKPKNFNTFNNLISDLAGSRVPLGPTFEKFEEYLLWLVDNRQEALDAVPPPPKA